MQDLSLDAPRAARALALYGLTVGTFFAASSAPTPLYRIYQQVWGFSSGTLTLVFASYAFSLLIALLTTGALSDHLGRRPVILGALCLEAVAMGAFITAHGVGILIAARVIQGFATGVAASALGAALLDVGRARGALVNSVGPVIGMGIGALGASLLVEHAPWPRQLVYLLLLAMFAMQAVGVMRTPESVRPRPGVLRSLRPRVRVPQAARGALWRVAPADIAVWALGGFYLSLGPSLARLVTGSDAASTGGWMVFLLTACGSAAVLCLRRWSAPHLLGLGASILPVGLMTTLAGVHLRYPAVFFLGTAIAGTGFGTTFQGALRSTLPLAEPHERAGLMAAFYVLSYLAFSLPALAAGAAAHRFGLAPTTDVYACTLALLALATAALAGFTRGRATV